MSSLVLLKSLLSVNICGRRRGRKSHNNGLVTRALSFSSLLFSRSSKNAQHKNYVHVDEFNQYYSTSPNARIENA